MAGAAGPRPLPEGTVTFLFSDLEGSTRLLEAYGEATGRALLRHHELFEQLIERNRGVIFETVGDAVYAAFASPPDALRAAVDAHRALASAGWEEIGGRLACRIAVHTGPVERRGRRYFGAPLFRCARLQALAYGEQTVVSGVTAAMTTGSLPDGAVMIDRGMHRLKDLQEPEHVFELQHTDLRTEFPPLKSLDARRHNLPVQLSTFVGRADDLAAVTELIREHRLVTLLGPGGMGKTRLALQAAADAIDAFPDGAWFVDLSAVTDAERVPAEIGVALGLREEADAPVAQTVAAHLRDKHLLLVLDNLEQLLPAAALTIADLLSGAPEIRVLATSRRPSRIRGEQEYDLAPLAAGRPDMADEVLPDAVALFLARAREIRPDLAVNEDTGRLIAAICNQLDGLPLAIELATARLRLFNLDVLHDRLQARLPVLTGGAVDLPERQQTLRATIAWSEELLSADERRLFHRLAAFAGGCTLDGALAVSPGEEVTAVEQGVANLLEQSLVRRQDATGELRFTMLETIREYAGEQLKRDGAYDETMSQVAGFLIDMNLALRDGLMGKDQVQALQHLLLELPNERSAFTWLQEQGEGDRLVRLVGSLGTFLSRAGMTREGLAWLEAAAAAASAAPADARAMLNYASGILLSDSAPGRAVDAYREAIAIYEAEGNLVELGRTLVGLSNALMNRRQNEEGQAVAERALAVSMQTNDLRTQAAAIGNVASADLQAGRIAEAEIGFHKAVELFEACGDIQATVIGFGNLGEAAARRGDHSAALAQHRRGVDAARASGNPGLLGWELMNLAEALARTGQLREAIPSLLEGLRALLDSYDLRSFIEGLAGATSLLAAAGDPDGAAKTWRAASELSRSLNIPLEPWIVEAAEAAVQPATMNLHPSWDREPGIAAGADVTVDAALEQLTIRLHALEAGSGL